MSAHTYSHTLTPGGPTGARSFSVVAAAIAAICVLSSTLVLQELAVAPPAHAATTAPTSDFQSRWWPGEVRQVNLRASIMPHDDLTFANGYAQRVAARQAARLAASGAESQFGRSAVVVRKASTVARADAAPNLPRVSAAAMDALVERPGRPDIGSQALAFGEQRPRQRGFGELQGPFANLFGNLY
jgi:hypothetical protein